MSIKNAARAVVQLDALRRSQDPKDVAVRAAIADLQRELALDGDRTDLASAINARRQNDNVERMQSFRAKYDELVEALIGKAAAWNATEAEKALTEHLFGKGP